MAIVNAAVLSGIKQSFSLLFNEELTVKDPMWPKVATHVPSTGKSNHYPSVDDLKGLREWVGDREIQNLAAADYVIKNKSFEETLVVNRDDIEDDELGVYAPKIRTMSRNAVMHPDSLIFPLLNNGFSTIGPDGQFFFDTDHPVGTASQANTDGGAGTPWFLMDMSRAFAPLIFQSRKFPEFIALDSATDHNVFMRREFVYGVDYRGNVGYGLWQLAWGSKQPLTSVNFGTAFAAMEGRKNAHGTPLAIQPTLLVVPPSLRATASALILKEKDAAGADNVWFQTVDVLVSPWLA